MRTLSATLLASQKKPHRLPYVEAKVYDYEAGKGVSEEAIGSCLMASKAD